MMFKKLSSLMAVVGLGIALLTGPAISQEKVLLEELSQP